MTPTKTFLTAAAAIALSTSGANATIVSVNFVSPDLNSAAYGNLGPVDATFYLAPGIANNYTGTITSGITGYTITTADTTLNASNSSIAGSSLLGSPYSFSLNGGAVIAYSFDALSNFVDTSTTAKSIYSASNDPNHSGQTFTSESSFLYDASGMNIAAMYGFPFVAVGGPVVTSVSVSAVPLSGADIYFGSALLGLVGLGTYVGARRRSNSELVSVNAPYKMAPTVV